MNKEFLNIIKNHWENPKTESLKDKNLQLIERASIIEQMKKLNVTKLADIGCGNCEDTIFFSKNAKIVDAFDYSLKMLDESKNLIKINNNKNINLARLNLIEDEVQNKYDTIITKRTLINLGNFNNQKDSILKIHNAFHLIQ